MRSRTERSERLVVSIRFTRIPKLRGLTAAQLAALLRDVARTWIETGELPRGFEIAIRWKNPDNRNERHADWKETIVTPAAADEDDAHDARITLNRGGWLAAKVSRMRFTAAARGKR